MNKNIIVKFTRTTSSTQIYFIGYYACVYKMPFSSFLIAYFTLLFWHRFSFHSFFLYYFVYLFTFTLVFPTFLLLLLFRPYTVIQTVYTLFNIVLFKNECSAYLFHFLVWWLWTYYILSCYRILLVLFGAGYPKIEKERRKTCNVCLDVSLSVIGLCLT